MSLNPAITEKLNELSTGLLAGHHIFSRDYDAALARRFSQPDKWSHNIRISTQNSRRHIEQYFAIREQTYKTAIGANFYAGEDENDSKSHIVLALAGDNCIGGIRITVSSPEKPMTLPTECNVFQFSKIYGELDFSNLTYCEATRLAILPDFSNGSVLPRLFEEATRFGTQELGVEMVFGRSASTQTRAFRTHYKNMGYDLIIRRDIKPPSTGMDASIVQIFGIDVTPDRKYQHILESYNNDHLEKMAIEKAKQIEFV